MSSIEDIKVFEKGSEEVSKFIIPPMSIFEDYSPFRDYWYNVGYPHPNITLSNIARLLGKRNLPSLPMIFEGEWTEAKSLASFPNPRQEWSLIIENIKSIQFHHSCSQCHSYEHSEENCDGICLLLENCRYPLCLETEHCTLNCPLLVSRCSICNMLGHMDRHHNLKNFDILNGWITYRGFAHMHKFAGLIFSREVFSRLEY